MCCYRQIQCDNKVTMGRFWITLTGLCVYLNKCCWSNNKYTMSKYFQILNGNMCQHGPSDLIANSYTKNWKNLTKINIYQKKKTKGFQSFCACGGDQLNGDKLFNCNLRQLYKAFKRQRHDNPSWTELYWVWFGSFKTYLNLIQTNWMCSVVIRFGLDLEGIVILWVWRMRRQTANLFFES